MAKKVGRPKWMPVDLQQVELLAARGLSKEQIAHNLGISYQTLNERQKEFSEFSEALNRGKAKGIAQIANKLYENAYKENNLGAQIFYLKTQGGWRETEIKVIEGNQENPLQIEHKSPDLMDALQKVIDSVVRE